MFLNLAKSLSIDDLREVLKAVWDARTKWYYIGLELGIEPATLDAIEKDHKSSDDQFRHMLKKWLMNSKIPPTTETLSKALRSLTVDCGHLSIAKDVHYLCSDD